MDKMAIREAKLNKRSVVTDMNRNIFDLEMIAEEGTDALLEKEDNAITYMGEDGEPEDYDMDGDENF
jgi:mannitol/fructose-specific phosphotransferase system IIA component